MTEPETAIQKLFYSIHPNGAAGVKSAERNAEQSGLESCAGLLLEPTGKFKLAPHDVELRGEMFISASQVADAFEQSFRQSITKAELWLLMSLLSGHSLKEISVRDDVSYETRRHQLKTIQSKSGLRRQSDLLLQLSSMLAINARLASDAESVSADKLKSYLSKYWAEDQRAYPFTSAQGQRLLVGELGPIDGSPVLILHSGFFSVYPLPDTSRILTERGIRVIIPYRPGYFCDLSEQELRSANLDAYLSCLAEFISVYRLQYVPTLAFMQGVEIALKLISGKNLLAENVIAINANYSRGGAVENGSFHLRAAVKLAQSSPATARVLYRTALKSISSLPSSYFALKQYFGGSPADVQQIEKSLSERDLTSILKEAFLENLGGFVNDLPSVSRRWPDIPVEQARALRFLHAEEEAFSDLDALCQDPIYGKANHEFVSASGRIGLMRNSELIFEKAIPVSN